MRSLILTYLEANKSSGFGVSQNLPFDQNGSALYLQNLKQLYVDNPSTEQEPLYDTLDSLSLVSETTIVNIYVVTDAKTLPSNYAAMVATVKAVRTLSTIQGYTTKRCNVSTSYANGDQLVTQFEIRFTNII
tara:strand:+ start:4113 stop:4508 length:396 start_codon:yes stop_codon:yes gene_type:complete